ncbi:unnamed protein product, partial [Heterotrigona itama]
ILSIIKLKLYGRYYIIISHGLISSALFYLINLIYIQTNTPEMWFGIVFAVVVEIVPLHFRSTTIGAFLFVMNNIGGNLPILVEPTRMAIGFRESLYIFYAGFYGLSSILFFSTMFLMDGAVKEEAKPDISKIPESGYDNSTFTTDEGRVPTLELPRLYPSAPRRFENS